MEELDEGRESVDGKESEVRKKGRLRDEVQVATAVRGRRCMQTHTEGLVMSLQAAGTSHDILRNA